MTAAKRSWDRKAYLYILPTLAVIVLVFLFPLVQNARYSLLEMGQKGRPYSGMRNYGLLLSDDTFWISLRNNGLLILLVPLLVAVSLVFSVLLFQRIRGWKFYRGVVLFPYITSITAIGLFYSLFFQGQGMLNTFLERIGLGFLTVDWLGNKGWALAAVMFVVLWREFGFGTILFLARLMTVEEDIFDAARIDGAGWWRRMFAIVIPRLATVIEFYVFLMVVTMLSWVFNYVFVITLGGPARSTYVTEYYIFMQSFKLNRMGVASALSIILFLVTAALAFLSFRFRKRLYGEYE